MQVDGYSLDVQREKTKGYVSALTFANPVYVMRKELDPKEDRRSLRNIKFLSREKITVLYSCHILNVVL